MNSASEILSEALSERKGANPSYSLRAFARDLGLSAPQLSNVINGHRGLSPEMATKVATVLELTPQQKEIFDQSLKAKFSPRKADRVVAGAKLKSLQHHLKTAYLDLEMFKVVSHWYHFALIELIKISKANENKTSVFSERLGIPEDEVEKALFRLERVGLIQKTKDRYQVNQENVIADHEVPTLALQRFHQQILEKSVQALTFQSSEERYGYSAAMPVRVKNVARAKAMIQKFRTEFAEEVSDHSHGEEVYGLGIQFFRLTQKKRKMK